MSEIYIGQMRYEPAAPGRVGTVYTLAGGGPEGHLHDRYHKNVHHVYFSPADLRFFSAGGADLGVAVDDAEQERHLKVVETPLQTPNPRSPDYIALVGSTVGGHLPFVLWMRLDAGGVVHTHAAVRTPFGWHDRVILTGASGARRDHRRHRPARHRGGGAGRGGERVRGEVRRAPDQPGGHWAGMGDAIRAGTVQLYAVDPAVAFAFAKGDVYSQTRYRFS